MAMAHSMCGDWPCYSRWMLPGIKFRVYYLCAVWWRQIHWLWIDLWHIGLCKEVWAQVQIDQSKSVLHIAQSPSQHRRFILADNHYCCKETIVRILGTWQIWVGQGIHKSRCNLNSDSISCSINGLFNLYWICSKDSRRQWASRESRSRRGRTAARRCGVPRRAQVGLQHGSIILRVI